METICQDDNLAIEAAVILTLLNSREFYGRRKGFAVTESSKSAICTDYVLLAGRLFGFRVFVSKASIFDRTTHPYWAWIEKRKSDKEDE